MSNMKLMNCLQAEFHAVSKSEIRLEMFENKKNINKLNIFVLIKHVQKIVLELWNLLTNFMKSQYVINNHDTFTTYKSSMMIICSILTYNYISRKCNNFSMLLKLHLHSIKIKQQIINLFAELDVISSYWTISNKQTELTDIEKVLFLSCI